jgi:hypothetical protein
MLHPHRQRYWTGSEIQGIGRKIFVDNYFNSLKHSSDLRHRKINASQIWMPQNGAYRKPSTAATPSWTLVSQPHSKHEKQNAGSEWETWTVPTADRVCCAHVEWEIHFLSTFETAPFFCVCPVFRILDDGQSPETLQLCVLLIFLRNMLAE